MDTRSYLDLQPVHPETDIITTEDLQNLLGELRKMARDLLRSESNPHSVTPTALAISAILRAKCSDVDWDDVRWENRMHFFACLRTAMRHALIDHARRRKAKGRDKLEYVEWNDMVLQRLPEAAENTPDLVIALSEALAILQQKDEALSELVDLFYFYRYTVAEIVAFLGVDKKTGSPLNEKKVDRDLKKARLRLEEIITELLRAGSKADG